MKSYKRYGDAVRAAHGRPIIRIGKLHLVGDITELTSINLIAGSGTITGNITVGHLDRLGNANWAEAKQPIPYTSFPKDSEEDASLRAWEKAMGMRGYAGSAAEKEDRAAIAKANGGVS